MNTKNRVPLKMALESWEIVIFDLALGSLMSGFLLFFFSVFTAGIHFGHGGHGAHTGHVSHVSHFGHFGHWIHFGHLGHFGHSGHAHIHTQHQARLDQNPSTPILLIGSAFLLMFGAIGTVIYQIGLFDALTRILLAIILPIGFVKLVTILWNKIVAYEYGYEIPVVTIDNQVKTLTVVDEKGGLVLADTGNYDQPSTIHIEEKMKMPAKTLPGVIIERDQIAYVINIDHKNMLIIDSWPNKAKKDNISNQNILNQKLVEN